MTCDCTPKLGRVTQLSPLRVQLNGDRGDAPARAMDDFTGATAQPVDAATPTGTEVLVQTIEGRRYAERVRT